MIGWCFGGGWSLQTALAMPDKIDATVMYYGRLVNDMSQLEKLNSPVIGFLGEQDQGIPPKQVKAFEENLNKLGKDAEIISMMMPAMRLPTRLVRGTTKKRHRTRGKDQGFSSRESEKLIKGNL